MPDIERTKMLESIICIKIIFSKSVQLCNGSCIRKRTVLPLEKQGWKIAGWPTNKPLFLSYIIWTRNGNIFHDHLNIIPITIGHESKTHLVIIFSKNN